MISAYTHGFSSFLSSSVPCGYSFSTSSSESVSACTSDSGTNFTAFSKIGGSGISLFCTLIIKDSRSNPFSLVIRLKLLLLRLRAMRLSSIKSPERYLGRPYFSKNASSLALFPFELTYGFYRFSRVKAHDFNRGMKPVLIFVDNILNFIYKYAII